MYFSVGYDLSLWAHVALLLDDRPMKEIHIQPVLHNGWSNVGHLLRSEGEHISIFS